jgi:hypothetical protein
MKVLVACEESQAVCKVFRELGHEAYSCDILPCSGGHPEWHIQCNVLDIIGDGDKAIPLQNQEYIFIQQWDLMIAHPPCTYLSNAGAGWDKRKPERIELRKEAISFFLKLLNAPIPKICVENPVMLGIAKKEIGNYSQIIEPYYFGHQYKKKTCLWLKNLPLLKKTNQVIPNMYWVNSSSNYRKTAKMSNKGKARSSIERSKTFPGIAKAMAEQWGGLV